MNLFAVSYFATMLGEAQSVMETPEKAVVFWHEATGLEFAVILYDDGRAFVNENLPSDIYYQLRGYCAVHNISVAV